MEYACGRSLTDTENCVVELKSIYMLSTLVCVSLLHNNLTHTTLLNGVNDRWLMVSTLLNVFSVLHHIKIDTWLACISGCNRSKWQKLHIVHLTFNSIGQEIADAIVAQPWLMCN